MSKSPYLIHVITVNILSLMMGLICTTWAYTDSFYIGLQPGISNSAYRLNHLNVSVPALRLNHVSLSEVLGEQGAIRKTTHGVAARLYTGYQFAGIFATEIGVTRYANVTFKNIVKTHLFGPRKL